MYLMIMHLTRFVQFFGSGIEGAAVVEYNEYNDHGGIGYAFYENAWTGKRFHNY